MPTLVATFALICSLSTTEQTVRISVFSLFKPQAAEVRIARGEARVESADFSGPVSSGSSVRVRSADAHINVTLIDALGRPLRAFTAREVRIISSSLITLTIPGKISREFRGQVEMSAGRGKPLQVVVETKREDAVASVTAAEMKSRRREALKAMSVMARTYMMSHPGRHRDEGFDFCDTTHCQLYRGEADLANETLRREVTLAVEATEGERLSFNDSVVEVYFTAVCGGLSATPAMVWGGQTSYRYSRVSCQWCRASPYRRWERTASVASVLDALSYYLRVNISQDAEIIVERSEDDPAQSVTIRNRGRQMILSADEFRRAIGLRLGWNKVLSPTFDVERRGQRFIFRGRGFGSQVGLCIEGAASQAAEGRSYRDILLFYFPQTEIERVSGEKRVGVWECGNVGEEDSMLLFSHSPIPPLSHSSAMRR
jgi:stage II sporulation protein D